MPNFWKTTLLGGAIAASLVITPLPAEDKDHKAPNSRTYHDKKHNDDHEWNNHEDQAYRIWAKENHRKEGEFSKLKESDQQNYWAWRHDHSDALLKIDIR